MLRILVRAAKDLFAKRKIDTDTPLIEQANVALKNLDARQRIFDLWRLNEKAEPNGKAERTTAEWFIRSVRALPPDAGRLFLSEIHDHVRPQSLLICFVDAELYEGGAPVEDVAPLEPMRVDVPHQVSMPTIASSPI